MHCRLPLSALRALVVKSVRPATDWANQSLSPFFTVFHRFRPFWPFVPFAEIFLRRFLPPTSWPARLSGQPLAGAHPTDAIRPRTRAGVNGPQTTDDRPSYKNLTLNFPHTGTNRVHNFHEAGMIRCLGFDFIVPCSMARATALKLDLELERWSVADAAELYEVARWGNGYFSVNGAGHVCVHPTKDLQRSIDLKQLVDRLQLRGIDLPILIRFADILKHRLGEMHGAFTAAMTEQKYQGEYCCVYPIKVNQQRQVVEEVLEFGRPYHFGLEAGSKPELLAVVAMASNDTPIICNGFKDAEFIETAMLAHKIGRNIIPVVEKYTELGLILEYAEKIGVRPKIGVRVKLAARGAGRWQSSGGYRSKFGLTVTEILKGLEELKARGMQDCFKLLHFHQGSQITNIRHIKAALNEAAHVFTELASRGAGLEYLDVGGGLGIDYDGSQTNFESSVNYSLQEYANDVVYHIQRACDDAGVKHPTIISESGRAVVAYHSMLVFGVLGVSEQGQNGIPPQIPSEAEQPLIDLMETYQNLGVRNILESWHDAQQSLDNAMTLFSNGYLPLDQRSTVENLYWAICHKIQKLAQQMEFVPEELQGLDSLLSDTYFCNFSLFQSIPDSWAIKQLFPLMPIHRLNERPTRHAVLGDITCDSDGKVDQFIDRRDVKRTLPLHQYEGKPYYLGAFLIGAYQEILGDLHNLFGDTNAVHVAMDDSGEVILQAVIKGDTVREVLDYVEFEPDSLVRQLRDATEAAVREGRIGYEQAGRFLKFYEEGLQGYTYLEEPDER
jgi:arginine decarboxylase